jgi:hypothetical protein
LEVLVDRDRGLRSGVLAGRRPAAVRVVDLQARRDLGSAVRGGRRVARSSSKPNVSQSNVHTKKADDIIVGFRVLISDENQTGRTFSARGPFGPMPSL